MASAEHGLLRIAFEFKLEHLHIRRISNELVEAWRGYISAEYLFQEYIESDITCM
jgi:hypothetical protein